MSFITSLTKSLGCDSLLRAQSYESDFTSYACEVV